MDFIELEQKFRGKEVKPNILTLGQLEKIEDCVNIEADGRVRIKEQERRRMMLQLCYGITEEDLKNIPAPLMKDLLEAAYIANMGTSELSDFQAARKLLELQRK